LLAGLLRSGVFRFLDAIEFIRQAMPISHDASFLHQITRPVNTMATSNKLVSDATMCEGKPQMSPV
jgi:hypothetical protein